MPWRRVWSLVRAWASGAGKWQEAMNREVRRRADAETHGTSEDANVVYEGTQAQAEGERRPQPPG